MPKANQKRGRRMKRKHDDVEGEHDFENLEFPPDFKRLRSYDATAEEQRDHMAMAAATAALTAKAEGQELDEGAGYDHTGMGEGERYGSGYEQQFFGMLDEQELEYFKRTEELFELDSFETPEERLALVKQVYREAEGKELKIAQSQGASRLLERLIRMSTARQLKGLFASFSGSFLQLMSHRFASHVCESLFTHAAPFVSNELITPKGKQNGRKHKGEEEEDEDEKDPNEVYVSMENLFLHTLAELDGNLPFMLTDRYASHALRALLLVLAGEPITKSIDKQVARGKGRGGENNNRSKAINDGLAEDGQKKRAVPDSFSAALEKLISGSVAGFDTPKLRAMATHQIASPTLQILLRIEMTHYGRQRAKDVNSIMHTLLPDDPFTAECESAAFLSGLAYDSIGAHLVEAIIRWAPAKLFKQLYSLLFKQRLASYARNEIATYIDCRIIERLGQDDLSDAYEILAPLIPTLCERKWTALTRTLIERCAARNLDTKPIAKQLDQAFSGSNGSFDIHKMLNVPPVLVADPKGGPPILAGDAPAAAFRRPVETAKVHFNLLAQAMLLVPGPLSDMILDSLGTCPAPTLHAAAYDPVVTRTLQQALTTPHATILQRRKLILPFYGGIGAMALDSSASRVVDCIWGGTYGLAFIRERIAEELAENEAALRESPCGRAVWRNWKMDLYKRRRGEWVRHSRVQASNDGFQSLSELDEVDRGGVNGGTSGAIAGSTNVPGKTAKDRDGGKTPLQLARERHAKAKAEREAKAAAGTGANSSSSSSKKSSRAAPEVEDAVAEDEDADEEIDADEPVALEEPAVETKSKTPLQLARERHAKKSSKNGIHKAGKEKRGSVTGR